jgi:hypothetical protein
VIQAAIAARESSPTSSLPSRLRGAVAAIAAAASLRRTWRGGRAAFSRVTTRNMPLSRASFSKLSRSSADEKAR